MKHQTKNRILSFFLALVMGFTSAPFPVNSVEVQQESQSAQSGSNGLVIDYKTLKITHDGKRISELALQAHEKIEIWAEGISDSADYQWQIQHPDNDEIWVNIYDGTEQVISVTKALVNNVLRADGTVKLRCRAYTDTYAYFTDPVTVTLYNDPKVITTPFTQGKTALADGDDPSDEPREFVSIRVNYLRYDYIIVNGTPTLSTEGVEAFTPYVATILYNGSLGTQDHPEVVKFPTIVGYDSYLVTTDGNGNKNETKASQLEIFESNVTEDIVYTVAYKPAEVKYVVHYFFQNIYDDNYVEDAAETVTAKGETGSAPKKEHVNATFPGFTTMYYEPDVIAADGSTVFEVFYERNYYLMDFDCAGGYGTDPVYVRYGTYISVPEPIYTGWSFQYWNMTGAWDEAANDIHVKLQDEELVICDPSDPSRIIPSDGNGDALPITMPCFNTSYVAVWEEADTSYTVAYWIKGENGNDHTFLGSATFSADTNETVVPRGDYSNYIECVKEEHTHTDSCYSCSSDGHTHHYEHEESCYSYILKGDPVGSSDYNVIMEANATDTPQNGDIYFIYGGSDMSNGTAWRYWPKMYFDGTYYTISINNDNKIDANDKMNYVEGGQIGNIGNADGLYAERYRGKTTCNMTICVINCNTEAHIHTDACKAEMGPYVLYDKEFTLEENASATVNGDGATVINEYYYYKTYEIRFVYARATPDTNGEYTIFHLANETGRGSLEEETSSTASDLCEWKYTVDSLPTVEDPDHPAADGETYEPNYFEREYDDIVYRFYYISLTAQFGADISGSWPVNNVDDISGYLWGSWASEEGSPYRIKYAGNNANIMGTYPTMSAELINENAEIVDTIQEKDQQGNVVSETNVYLAQTMNAWWGKSEWGTLVDHAYHSYLQVLSLPQGLLDQTKLDPSDPNYIELSEDPYNPTKYENKYYIRRGYEDSNGDTTYKYYELSNDVFRANHDIWTRVYPPEFIGFEIVDKSKLNGLWAKDFGNATASEGDTPCAICHPVSGTDANGDPVYAAGCNYCNVFYFDRSIHKLYFWNYNKSLMDRGGSDVAYGTSLKMHGAYFDPTSGIVIPGYEAVNMNVDYYPDGLEPGAYFFDGWYTTPGCLPGTEMKWENETMPDSDFTVYAKWSPVIHDIYFYYDYEDFSAFPKVPWSVTNPGGNPIKVEHGSHLYSEDYKIPTREGYNFIGWFYLDDNGKKKFAPESMEIRREMHLFAEWISSTGEPTTYEVTYWEVDPEGKPVTEIASPTTGYSTAGKTKTFSAKGNSELYSAYQESYFPQTASHSILMGELDGNGNTPNIYQFRYVRDEEVWYKVRYVDAATNTEIPDVEPLVDSTNHAVITLRYRPISGYVPMPGYYYQTKALSSDDAQSGSATNVIEANVITFYYMKDTDHSAYSIEYYVEDDNGSEVYNDTHYTLKTSFSNTADLFVDGQPNVINSGDGGEFTVLSFDGYSFSTATVTNFYDDGTPKEPVHYSQVPIQGTLDENGLTIKLYYSKNSYDYTIKYMLYGTDTLLKVVQSASAPFGEEIKHTADEFFEQDGAKYDYYLKMPEGATDAEYDALRTQTITIRMPVTDDPATDVDETYKNELVFYYTQRLVTVLYVPVCQTVGATDFGSVTFNSELAANAGALNGSTANPGIGFKLVGWYSDETCKTKVPDAWVTGNKLKPGVLPNDADSVTYYALFEPIVTSLAIRKEFNTAHNTDDIFLFRVKGEGKNAYVDLIITIQGKNSVVMDNLPVGTYTITELTGWSYQYTQQSVSITEGKLEAKENESNVILFINQYEGSDWLGDEAYEDNDFGQYLAP